MRHQKRKFGLFNWKWVCLRKSQRWGKKQRPHIILSSWCVIFRVRAASGSNTAAVCDVIWLWRLHSTSTERTEECKFAALTWRMLHWQLAWWWGNVATRPHRVQSSHCSLYAFYYSLVLLQNNKKIIWFCCSIFGISSLSTRIFLPHFDTEYCSASLITDMIFHNWCSTQRATPCVLWCRKKNTKMLQNKVTVAKVKLSLRIFFIFYCNGLLKVIIYCTTPLNKADVV